MPEQRKVSPAIAAIIVIVLIGIATTAVVVLNNKQNISDTFMPFSATSSSTTQTTHGAYKDGTYFATGSYSTPDGRESIDVTITLASNVVTTTKVSQEPQSRESVEYQSRFAANYKSLVVGKNVDSVWLSRVAGSSLTSGGFNKALEQIKSDASI